MTAESEKHVDNQGGVVVSTNLSRCNLDFIVDGPDFIKQIECAYEGIFLEKRALFEQGYCVTDPKINVLVSANWRGGQLVASIAIDTLCPNTHLLNKVVGEEGFRYHRLNVQVDRTMLDTGEFAHCVKGIVPTLKGLVFHDNVSHRGGEKGQRSPVHRSVEVDFCAPVRKVELAGLFTSSDEVTGVDALIQDVLQISHHFGITAQNCGSDIGQFDSVANSSSLRVFDSEGVVFVGLPKRLKGIIDIIELSVD